MKFNGITNHWKCCKDWLEFKLFDIIIDYDNHYVELVILNFEFNWYKEE
jgi:hypothetical protein